MGTKPKTLEETKLALFRAQNLVAKALSNDGVQGVSQIISRSDLEDVGYSLLDGIAYIELIEQILNLMKGITDNAEDGRWQSPA